MTLLRPKPGAREDVQALLEELDAALAGSDGLLLSFVTSGESDRLGRVSVWRTKEEANRRATGNHILALRSRLRFLSLDMQEVLMDAKPGAWTEELASMLSGAGDGRLASGIREPEVA